MVSRLFALALAAALAVSAPRAADKPVAVRAGQYALDLDAQGGWSLDRDLARPDQPESAPPRLLAPEVLRNETGESQLVVETEAPRSVGIMRHVGDDRTAWGKGHILSARILAPLEMGSHPSVQLIAHHPVWGWFAAHPTRPLDPGRWTQVYWPLTGDSTDWESLESDLAWNDTLRWGLDRVGLRVYCQPPDDAQGPVRVHFADLAINGLDEPIPALETRNVRAISPRPSRGKRYELNFDLSRWYENPFDPDQVRVDAEFTAPSGRKFTIPAFYYQDFARRRLADGSEACDARGKAHWKARFRPLEAGPHRFVLRVNDWRGDKYESPPRTFDVEDAPFKGFVRVDPADPCYLSFSEDNSYFWPVGMIVRSPWDKREQYAYEFEIVEGRGTYAYDEYFTSMSQAGMNFSRVWMAAWWTALEWSHGYRRDYAGIGRYNQLNAWRMDYVVDLAERLGIYIDVTLHNHGQFRARDFDSEWYDNAYYSGQGGPVDRPEDFWTDPTAHEYVRKRLRYIVARWASNPAIGWWELSNEVDLVSNYNSARIALWHREMGRYLKEIDPYRHITTTHYTYGHYDPVVLGLPQIEIGQSTAYRADMIQRCIDLYNDHHVLGKPTYVNEFGVGNSHLELRYNLHAGLWTSAVMPFCGAALFWWWPYVQEKNEYPQYESVIRFRQGQDDRGKNWQLTRILTENAEPTDDAPPPTDPLRRVRAVGMQNDQAARLWVYDPWIYQGGTHRQAATPVPRPLPATRLRIPAMRAGAYRVVLWDCWEGREASRETVQHTGGDLFYTVPPFQRDMALRIDLLAETATR